MYLDVTTPRILATGTTSRDHGERAEKANVWRCRAQRFPGADAQQRAQQFPDSDMSFKFGQQFPGCRDFGVDFSSASSSPAAGTGALPTNNKRDACPRVGGAVAQWLGRPLCVGYRARRRGGQWVGTENALTFSALRVRARGTENAFGFAGAGSGLEMYFLRQS